MQATGVGTLVVWRRGRGRRRILTKNLFCDELEPAGRPAGSPQQTGSHQEL